MNTHRRERIINEVEAAGWIESGMTVAVGQPAPMALVRQIIRRGLKDLTMVDNGLSLDMLISAGCVRKVVSYYAGGGFGPVTPSLRAAAERGEVEWSGSARRESCAPGCRRPLKRCPSCPGGPEWGPRCPR